MKQIALLILLILPIQIFSQTSGIVVDKKTRKPIEYVNIWVENQDIGTTSDIEGKFTIKENVIQKTLIISAIGYENQRFVIDNSNLKIQLNPKTYSIKELVVKPKKNKETVIDKYKKRSVRDYFVCFGSPWIITKFFEFSPEYEQTPYLKKLRILTNSEQKDSKFNLRLIYANEKGEPTSDILKENLIVSAKKGKNYTTVDLTEYNISIPKDGIFISFEWLIVENNKYEYDYHVRKNAKKISGIKYNPSFGVVILDENIENWVYVKGAWSKTKLFPAWHKEKSMDLAIELTLSN